MNEREHDLDRDGTLVAQESQKVDPLEQAKMKKVASASFVGTLIEFYDLGIYGFAAALVFGSIFFPALGTAEATVASFATLGVAFVARPLGAIAFGHFGDRLGRKKTLVITLLVMGIATVAVGLLPSANQIGIVAPILLIVLRVMQGLAAGGEWAGAVLFAAESAPQAKRGFWSMFASLGAGVALALAPATFLLTNLLMSDEAFLSWGWRIPFLASSVLLAVGLWIRMAMEETPVFKDEVARGGVSSIPFVEAIKAQYREILLAAGMMMIIFSFGQLGSAYLPNYGTMTLEFTSAFVLLVSVGGGISYTCGILLCGIVSDTVGRRRVVMTAALAGVIWALLVFSLLDGASKQAFAIAVVVTLFIAGSALGPVSAFVSELFDTRYRYTAVGLSYNLAGILGGALTPILAATITAAYGGAKFGYLLAGVALVSLLCALVLKETRDTDLSLGHANRSENAR